MARSLSGAAARLALLAVLLPAAVPAQETSAAPKSVSLTTVQKQSLRSMRAASMAKAGSGLSSLAQASRKFNANLLSETPDPKLDQDLSRQLVETFAEILQLRLARLRSSAAILSREQKAALAEELKKPDAPFLFDDLVRKVLGDPKK